MAGAVDFNVSSGTATRSTTDKCIHRNEVDEEKSLSFMSDWDFLTAKTLLRQPAETFPAMANLEEPHTV